MALQHRLLGEAEGGEVNEAVDYCQKDADEGIERDEEDRGEGEEEEQKW